MGKAVDCMRRFFVPDKEKCEAFLRAQRMWWSEAWEPLGDLAERNPNRRTGGLRIQSCYATVAPYIYFIIYSRLLILNRITS